ncbi:phosphopantetheine-binding protein [Streptomyces sp. NPDC005533]|uniref:phosphopantetheine-binding protein n=1 Tax=Streptomyces sp. NPDC005533 TaxID=3364723 RepID=UPI0036A8F649
MTDRPSTSTTEVDLDGDPADVVAAVWAEALGLDAVDPDEGFFDLGATSVMVVDVVRVLRRRWPGIKIVDVFSRPTVRQLAAFLGDG